VIGLVVGSLVIGLGLTGVLEDTGLEIAVHYLGAIPPYSIPGFTDLPEPVIVQSFLIWWPILGAGLGWLVSRGRGGRMLAVAVIPVMVVLHVQTKMMVDERLEEAAENFNYLLETLID